MNRQNQHVVAKQLRIKGGQLLPCNSSGGLHASAIVANSAVAYFVHVQPYTALDTGRLERATHAAVSQHLIIRQVAPVSSYPSFSTFQIVLRRTRFA
jgi:hypothetical protein